MKKLSLIITFLLAVLLLHSCKKDTVTAYATSSNTLFAIINDSTWSATDISASMAYNTASKTKVFTCTGTADNKRVTFTVTATNQSNTGSFPLQTFLSDGAGTTFAYLTSTGSGGYIQQGTVATGSGNVIFTSVDSVAHKCSGTFSLTAKQNNYDTHGNIISVTINEVNNGAFNNLPYTFTSN